MTNFILKDASSTEVVNVNLTNSQISGDTTRLNIGITLPDGVITLGSFFSQFGLVCSFTLDGAQVCSGTLRSINISSTQNEAGDDFDNFQFGVEL